jgi:2-polyprenyl-3-methyl-5-hydroxy-6-metoxy-1,4-benzoquinol methylase
MVLIMDKKVIRKHVNAFKDDWYYYYNFDGIEARKNSRKDKTSGIYNWEYRIKPVINYVLKKTDNCCIFDIGCNMCLYGHMMSKMGIKVYAMDKELKLAYFYKRYVEENLREKWDVYLIEDDVINTDIVLPETNVVTMFCVIYHIIPYEDKVIKKLSDMCPNHSYIVMQGNKPRLKKKPPQEVAGVKGMDKLLKKHGYETIIFDWNKYPKPIVVGKRYK